MYGCVYLWLFAVVGVEGAEGGPVPERRVAERQQLPLQATHTRSMTRTDKKESGV